jgi:hypothetical protein
MANEKQVQKSSGMAKAADKASTSSSGKTWGERHRAKQQPCPAPKYQAK